MLGTKNVNIRLLGLFYGRPLKDEYGSFRG